jgi:hypothetical protein
MRRPADGVGCAADLYCRGKLLTIVAQPESKLTLTAQHMDSWEPRPLFTGNNNPEDWETLARPLLSIVLGFPLRAGCATAGSG